MAILTRSPDEKTVIDLDGPHGNAFVLLNTAKGMARKLGWTKELWESVFDQMIKDDYERLITRFDGYFGEYFDLIRSA